MRWWCRDLPSSVAAERLGRHSPPPARSTTPGRVNLAGTPSVDEVWTLDWLVSTSPDITLKKSVTVTAGMTLADVAAGRRRWSMARPVTPPMKRTVMVMSKDGAAVANSPCPHGHALRHRQLLAGDGHRLTSSRGASGGQVWSFRIGTNAVSYTVAAADLTRRGCRAGASPAGSWRRTSMRATAACSPSPTVTRRPAVRASSSPRQRQKRCPPSATTASATTRW